MASSKKNEKIILKDEYNKLENNNFYDNQYQKFLVKKEVLEKNSKSNKFDFLYPHLNDSEFNIKISQKKEFNEHSYDGNIYDLEKHSNDLCNAEFELNPHQLFVKNFLSFHTPYNSLLLYHGLGTGKTCTAITVAEEMRDYLKQLKIFQRIIVVASPNVQENFKLQLFDERKLELINNLWTMNSNCVGNKFLKELNPTNTTISKEKMISQIKRLVQESYLFMGYREFASYIHKVANIEGDINSERITNIQKKKLQKIFDNRLIIIDEVHNIRLLGTSDKHDKKIANTLTKLVKYTNNMKLLMLSGTPMYNHYSEIIWLINIMNLNDNRSMVNKNDIFDKDGNFLVDKSGNEIGKDLFIQKITGYVSFVRGENPYIFPYRIYPTLFEPKNSVKSQLYPRNGINEKPISIPIQHMDLYTTKLLPYQEKIYKFVINKLKKKANDKLKRSFEDIESFGYNDLQYPLEALNITFPIDDIEENDNIQMNQLVGKGGLNRIITYEESNLEKKNYAYKSEILKKFGRIFSLTEINKYSSKIFSICKNIINSEGVIMIYSQYIEGGLIPLALTLEEMGFTRFGTNKSMFQDEESSNKQSNLKYVMITGDPIYSKNNNEEINACTNINNVNGEKVKVILISKAGSEGIDFKYIRQVHILEPWYNTSRIEQIIGRAVRSKSHCDLPFQKRNVQIFLYTTILSTEEEAADMYVYRIAETKAIQIGKISRTLKESCVDCIIHHGQTNFTEEKFNQKINVLLSNKSSIEYNVGDKPFSNICDYLSECNYTCTPNEKIDNINLDTYNKEFIELNNDKLVKKIKLLFKEYFYLDKQDMIKYINTNKTYPIEHIHSALDYLINNKNEFIIDRFGTHGRLINIDNYYIFQPINNNNETISIYDRKTIPAFKNHSFSIKVDEKEKPQEKYSEKKNSVPQLSYIEFIKSLETKFNKIISIHEVKKGNKDIDLSFSKIYHLLKNKFDNKYLEDVLIDHIVENISFTNKLILLNYLYYNKLTEFETKLKKYFDKNILKHNDEMGIYLFNDHHKNNYKNDSLLFVKENNNWETAKMTSTEIFNKLTAESLKEKYRNFNSILGYTSYIKKGDIYVFKTIDLSSDHKKRGKRCDQSGKTDIIKIFNKTEINLQDIYENIKEITSLELCCIQELLFRYFTLIKQNNKIWYLNNHDAYLFELANWKLTS